MGDIGVVSYRIVIDAREINSSTGRYVERLLTYLCTIDHTNHYFIIIHPKDEAYWTPTSKNFTLVTSAAQKFTLAEQLSLKREIESLEPDLVHFCMPQQPVLYSGKKVTTIHDLFQLSATNPTKNQLVYKLKQSIGWFVFKHVIRSSDHIITDSDYSKQSIEHFSKYAVGKTSTVYLSADKLTVADPIPYELPSKDYILYVGQQSSHKNIRRLIEAHQQLLAEHPDLWLVLVGKVNAVGELNRQWVQENNFSNVLFTGYVEDKQLAWLYEHALCYGFSSLMEGFGLPGLEAMQHGTPLVSSNATCSPEIFGDAAVYFDPTDVRDMAEKIGMVVDTPLLREKLRKKGYSQIKKYSWEKMAKETHDIYMSVLRNKS